MPDNTGIQWEVANYGGNKPALPFYITSENLTFRSPYAFSNLIMAFTISWRTSLRFIVLRTELVHTFIY